MTTYRFDVLALQLELACMILPESAFAVNVSSEMSFDYINVTADMPTACTSGAPTGLPGIRFQVVVSRSPDAWVAQYIDLDSMLPESAEASCPSVSIVFGPLGENNTKGSGLTALVCTQQIRELRTRVTYKGNPSELVIDLSRPPEPDEDSSTYRTNATSGSRGLSYRLQHIFEEGFTHFNDTDWINESHKMFFEHLLYESYNCTPDDLAGPTNANALINTVNRQYKDYMNLVIDQNFRQGARNADPDIVRINGQDLRLVTRLGIHNFKADLADSYSSHA